MRVLIVGGPLFLAEQLQHTLSLGDHDTVHLPGGPGIFDDGLEALDPFNPLIADLSYHLVLIVGVDSLLRLCSPTGGTQTPSANSLRHTLEKIRMRGAQVALIRVEPEAKLPLGLPLQADLGRTIDVELVSYCLPNDQLTGATHWCWFPLPQQVFPELLATRSPIENRIKDLQQNRINISVVSWRSAPAYIERSKEVLHKVQSTFPHTSFTFHDPTAFAKVQDLGQLFLRTDIFVDDLSQAGYSALAVKALSFGATVLGALSPEDRSRWSILSTAPVIATTMETLEKKCQQLLREPKSLRDLATRSVHYVQRNHDPQQSMQVLAQALGWE